MKYNLKKLFSICLVAMFAGTINVPALAAEPEDISSIVGTFPADTTNYHNNLADRVAYFNNESTWDQKKYGGWNATGHAENSVGMGTIGGVTAAVMYGHPETTTDITWNTWGGGGTPGNTSKLLLDFSFIKNDDDTDGHFFITARAKQREIYYTMLSFYNNTVYLMSTPVASFEDDVWYNLKFRMDAEKGIATLDMKKWKDNEESWKSYKVTYSDVYSDSGAGGWIQRYKPDGIQGFVWDTMYVQFGMKPGADDGEAMKVGIAALKQYYFEEDLDGSMPNLSDDFDDSGNYIEKADSLIPSPLKINSEKAWYYEGSVDEIKNENSVMKLQTSAQSTQADATVMRHPFSAASNVRHNINLTLGGNDKSQSQTLTLDFIAPSNSRVEGRSSGDLTGLEAVKLTGEGAWLLGEAVTGFIAEEEYLYDTEVIYDAASQMLIATLWDASGTQYIKTKTVDWNYLAGVRISHTVSAGDSGELYVDNFRWNVLQGNAKGVATIAGSSTAAYPDEEVTFTYDAPIKKETTEASAVLTLTKIGGELTTEAYELKVRAGRVVAEFKSLCSGCSYKASLSGVNLLDESESPQEVESIVFTVKENSDAYIVNAPTFSAGIITAKLKSGYLRGTPVILLAQLLNSDGDVIGTVTDIQQITDKGEILSVDLSAESFNRVLTYIWSGIDTMNPFCDVQSFIAE